MSPDVPTNVPSRVPYGTATDEEKLACAEREVRQRLQVYPRLVASGRMRQAKADREIEIMRAIADDYRARVSAKTPTLPLGGREA